MPRHTSPLKNHNDPHLVLRLKDLMNDWKQAVKERLSIPASSIPHSWQRIPDIVSGDRICLFVTVLRHGRMVPHAAHQGRAWAARGFKVLVIAVTNDLDGDVPLENLEFASGILLRTNKGYDFGAWSAAIQSLPMVREAGLLALANDSVFGPLDGFTTVLERVERSTADLVALTDSHHHRYHFQSYIMFYKRGAMQSDVFKSFWRKVRTGDRWTVIVRYETRLLKTFENAGLTGEVLFPSGHGAPPTLLGWKALVDRGFPFVKVQLLRDNPFNDDLSNWRDFIRLRGYDPVLCEDVLDDPTRRSSS